MSERASSILYVDTGGAFLESKSGAFRAAMVNPGKQQGRFYLVVLHAPSATVVWSANRGTPTTSSGPVQLTAQGLTVSDPSGKVLWSTPSQLGSPIAALRLQDSGNLQLLGAGNATLWQSFNAATDTLLPGQQLRADAYLAAAESATDLAEGDYRLAATTADVVLTWQGSTYWRLSNDLRSFKDRNVAVASVSVNASGLFAVAADGGLVFRVDLAAGAFPVLKLGYDGRLRITGYPLVNSSASLGGDFVVLANDCDLPLQCPPLGLCSPTGDGVCVWREKPTAPSRKFPRRLRPFTRRVAGVVLASGGPPPPREAAPPPRDAGAAPAGKLEAQESATARAPCHHGC
ncbi:G-type lectin S-receptor-like serine/threonine-protein kinase At5g35370 [Panicum virgatum]|uniref:G-type lectin S-receptor-like serine/threonine-protein kinase At5g35370 n=1 Tax=Panicum virgatum TaxID=38727 RepID=UPI0019D5C69F|nr:G-type lectin S-receptor-like serine/threonine-protein kinase At5g35370 [Panicum virgatum]